MLQIKFTTDLGAKVTIDASSNQEVAELQRHYGRMGWYSGEVPAGGFLFPLENEPDFDWALIGARKFKTSEGDEAVWCRGSTYKRRDLEEVNTKKLTLPRAVKYSRGARPTDPAHLCEVSDGEVRYVTLAIFRGGKRQERYATQEGDPSRNPQNPPVIPSREPVLDDSDFAALGAGPTLDAAQISELRALLTELGFATNDTAGRKAFLELRLGRVLRSLSEILLSELEQQRALLRNAKGKAEVRAVSSPPPRERLESSRSALGA